MDKTKIKHTRIEMALLLILFAAIFVAGLVFFRYTEGFGWADAIYLTSTTLTTLGHSQYVPSTDFGKIFISVYAFLGIVMFLGLGGLIFHGTLAYNRVRRQKRKTKKSK